MKFLGVVNSKYVPHARTCPLSVSRSSTPIAVLQCRRYAFGGDGGRGACGGRGRGFGGVNVMAAAQSNFTAWDTAVQRVPKRTDIKTIMLLGAGPIVIGQVSCRGFESGGFEFEGWRVCLWEEGKGERE